MGKRKFKEGDVVEFTGCSARYSYELGGAPPIGAIGTVNYYNTWDIGVFIDWADKETEAQYGDHAWPPRMLAKVAPIYTPIDYYQAITGE